MATMAKWGSKTWAVSAAKVVTLQGLSFSYAQVADNNASTEEKKTTNERGTELFPLSFSTTLHSGTGVDIWAEIESWKALVTKVNYFYLGGKKLGPKLQLRKVSVGDVKLDDLGRMRLTYYTTKANESEVVRNVEGSGGAIDQFVYWQSSTLNQDINPDELRKLILCPHWDEDLVGATRVIITKPEYKELPSTTVAKFSGNKAVRHIVKD